MGNYPGLNSITPNNYDPDKALAGDYGKDVKLAFEDASLMMQYDGNVDGKLSDGEIDYAINQITSDDNDPINMDDAKDIARTYGGEDRLLSLDEMAQVYLDGVLETSSDSDGTTVTLNRSRTSQAALLSGYMSYQYETDDRAGLSVKDLDKATDHFNRNRYALTEDQARLLIYAYGTNGNLVGSQLQQMFSDNEGVVSTQDNAGEAVELAIDLSKMPSRNVANLLMYKDYTDEGGDYNGEISYSEFDHATDNIFGDDSIVTEDQAKLLADAYGASGSLVRDEIKAMIDDGVLTIKTNSEGQLRGELKLYHIPSSRIADGLLAFGSNGHLTADELRQATSALGGGSGLNQDQARNIIYAWGSNGSLSSDALKEVLDDGAITLAYGGGGVLDVRYNPAAFTETGDSSRRQANILMFKDFTGTNPDDRITAEEFDHATDELFGDDRVVTEIQADALAGAYGTSGSLTRDDVKAMIEDGLLTVTSDDDGKLSGALHLDQWPSSRIPDALLAFDSDGNDTLDSVELARGLLAISGDDERRYDSEGRFLSSSIGIGRGIPTPEEGPHKKFANLILEAAGGKERGRDLFASLADDGVITGGHGDSAYEAPAASTLLNSLVNLPDDGSSALSPELFKYFNTDALPGENGTITQLAFSKVLLDYKDAPKGSLEHTYHDLNKVKYFATHDAPSGGLFRDLKKRKFRNTLSISTKLMINLKLLPRILIFPRRFAMIWPKS
ncbi:MAG: hypothetical protein HC850_08825 [Rhodomicrobium sp.]|nr:hypothetical protein [Rhodomicrobium sp.]